MDLNNIILLSMTLWNLVLTISLFILFRNIKSIGNGSKTQPIFNTMQDIMKKYRNYEDRLRVVESSISDLSKMLLRDISKVGFVRFNPFEDTGSNQSFSVAFLNRNNDGLVISSLHGRSGTRVYLKPVKAGKQDNYELSEEESKAVSEALK